MLDICRSHIAIQDIDKTKTMSGGALRRHSSFGFYVLSKSYIAIHLAITLYAKTRIKIFFKNTAKHLF
jgi:hypothetical protein